MFEKTKINEKEAGVGPFIKKTIGNLCQIGKRKLRPGTDPIDILQHKFTLCYFFKHFDWLKKFRIQSECL